MSVQAVFFVKELKHIASGGPENIAEVTLSAAFGSYLKGLPGGDEMNKDWSKYTPCGEIKLTITNPAAIEEFDIGGVYKTTFEKVG